MTKNEIIYTIDCAKDLREAALRLYEHEDCDNYGHCSPEEQHNSAYRSCYGITENLKALKSLMPEEEFEAYTAELNDWATSKAKYPKDVIEQVRYELSRIIDAQ